MTALVATGGAILTIFSFVLALIAGLIAWKAAPSGRRMAETGEVLTPSAADRLEELRHDLDRELHGAVDAVAAIRCGSIADRRNPHLASRLAMSAGRIGRWSRRLSPPDTAREGAEQARRLGLAVIDLQSAALAAARQPDEVLLAEVLATAMDDLDQAVGVLTAVPPGEVARTAHVNRKRNRPGEPR